MTPEFSQAIDPIFMHVLGLLDRIEHGDEPAPEEERLRIRALTDQAEAILGKSKEWELAKFGLISWIDELLVDAPWEGRDWWSNNVLEMQLFNSRKAYDQFFIMAVEAASLTGKDALEVFYVCAILGFRGLYRDVDSGPALAQSLNLPQSLEEWSRQSATSIRLGLGRPDLGPTGTEKEGAPPLRPISSVVWPWLVSLMVGTTAVLYYFYRNG
ncbi:MAG: type IV secretion protein DotU [Planctomycetaceae bacterium]|nr:type IV secretion protein DotU [Planctomycetaceae bacterium]